MSEAFDRAKLRAELDDAEDFMPHAYQDSEGFWTIGFGRLIDKRRGGGITREEGLYLLDHDIDAAITDLNAVLPRWRELTPERQRVMLALAYNLGRSRLGGFHRMLVALNQYLDGDSEAALDRAADELLDSKAAHQTGNRYPRYAAILRANRA